MKKNGWFSRYILIWTYGRGTLQYDIICILILAFIFLIDPACFNKKHNESMHSLTTPSLNANIENTTGNPRVNDNESDDSSHSAL